MGWATAKEHRAADITLLCDKHHKEKTNGLLSLEQVQADHASPYNLKSGVSKPYDLHFEGLECEIEIGSNRFVMEDQGYGTSVIPVSIDDVPLLAFIMADGHLLLNLNLFDESNNLVLSIKNNHLYYSTNPWDIQLVGRRLTIREAARKLLVEIEFQIPNKIFVTRGRLLRNGVELLVDRKFVLLTNTNMLLSGSYAHNCPGGLMIGPHAQNIPAVIRLQNVPRYLGDRNVSLRWAKENLD
jgi:trigger factor